MYMHVHICFAGPCAYVYTSWSYNACVIKAKEILCSNASEPSYEYM